MGISFSFHMITKGVGSGEGYEFSDVSDIVTKDLDFDYSYRTDQDMRLHELNCRVVSAHDEYRTMYYWRPYSFKEYRMLTPESDDRTHRLLDWLETHEYVYIDNGN